MPSGPRLKVGLVFDDSLDSNDGVAQYVKTLGSWLSGQGHAVSYLVGQTNLKHWEKAKIYSLARNLTVRFNGNRLSIPLVSSKASINEVIKTEQFDVLHVMMPYSPLMAARVIKQAKPGTAIVGTFHIFPAGRLSVIGSKLLKIVLKRSLRTFNAVVSVSPVAQIFAKEAYGIVSTVVPNPVDITRFKALDKKVKPRSPTIVFLGRLVKRKGCRQLIEAFAKIAPCLPAVELVIAGDGPQRRKLETLAKQLDVDQRIKFLGHIDEQVKPQLLNSATIACLPSLYGESFGIVLIEAMAAGAQIVLGGDNPGYRSVLGQQPKLLFNPKDTSVLAEKLTNLLQDDNLRQRLTKWQAEAVQQYDINVVGPRILEIYQAVIAPKNKKSHNKHHE